MSKCIRCGEDIGETGEMFCSKCERDVGGDAINNWKAFNEEMVDKYAKRSAREKELLNMLNTSPITVETLKDSGERREFQTGAVRDMAYGKGDMVSLPNAAILRLSKHYQAGASKYGRWNYTKGIPTSSFLDSSLRHIFKYLDGWDDEDHLAAAAFNILGAMEMEEHHPDMCDLPTRDGKNKFKYGE